MIHKPWLGLLAAGPMSPALFRMANLHAHLGPVAAGSVRVASRLANRLKAGTAGVAGRLGEAAVVLITGPEEDFPDLLQLATHSGIDWRGRTAVALDFRRDRSELEPLRRAGAATATLDSLEAFPDCRLVADADDEGRRALQKLGTATRAQIYFLEPGRKRLFAAGLEMGGHLLTAQFAAAVECMRRAGVSNADAQAIADQAVRQSVRAWTKSGRKGWPGTLAGWSETEALRHMEALRGEDLALADVFSGAARHSAGFFRDGSPASSIMERMDDSQTQRLAEAGRLAANLAHDWNNLLTLLAAQAAEITASLPAGHPAQNLAEELQETVAHAADSPRRLLQWLREEPGRMQRASLNRVILDTLPLVRLALGRRVDCRLQLDEAVPEIPLDGPLVRNALLNLANNAVQAMEGRGAFTIATAAASGSVVWTVADSGPGMDEETRRRVLEPFFSTRRENGGTGLGLETVKAVAAAHQAGIDIQTAPGQGCAFVLTFPVERSL